MKSLQIQLSFPAYESFYNDLKMNGIKFTCLTRSSFVMDNTPKVQMAIKLVKERFGEKSIYVTEIC
jgi:hypothetical protein